MIRPRFFRFLLWILFVGLVSPALGQDAAQLRFESRDPTTSMPKGWTSGIGKGTSGTAASTIALDSTIKQEGRYALSVEFNGASPFVSVVHVISKKPNAGSIKLTGFLKTESVEGRAGLWMRIDGKDGMLQFDNMESRSINGTTDWKKYEITLPYDKDEAERINVGALLVGKGKVWIDNFHITADGKDIQDIESYARLLLPAEKDTSNYGGSGVKSITLNPESVNRLADLGALWGFIKYYHAGVQEGNHNMDAALFRFLPMILAAKDSAQSMDFMERWVDMFGVPAVCNECKDVDQAKDVALKPDWSRLFRNGGFPPSLIAKLEHIRSNRSKGGLKHYYISMFQQVGNPQFNNEYAYEAQPYPDAGVRLLALYRYWNYIQYFFPYRHLIGEDWNKVLPEMIPEFCNAADTAAYQVVCLKLIAPIHDTHANLWKNAEKLEDENGKFIIPIRTRFIEGRMVVTGYFKDTLDKKPVTDSDVLPRIGDVVERIDDVAVEELVKKYLELTPASNYETQLRGMTSMRGLLLRSKEKEASIRITRPLCRQQ